MLSTIGEVCQGSAENHQPEAVGIADIICSCEREVGRREDYHHKADEKVFGMAWTLGKDARSSSEFRLFS
jgi:hypothetical protein